MHTTNFDGFSIAEINISYLKMIYLQTTSCRLIETRLLPELQACVKFAVYEGNPESPLFGLTSAMSISKDLGNGCNIPINTLRRDHDLTRTCEMISKMCQIRIYFTQNKVVRM